MPEIEDATHVRVRDLMSQLDFPFEARNHQRVRRELVADGLEGDALLQLKIFGLIDLAHTAAPDQGFNSITSLEDYSWRKHAAPLSKLA